MYRKHLFKLRICSASSWKHIDFVRKAEAWGRIQNRHTYRRFHSWSNYSTHLTHNSECPDKHDWSESEYHSKRRFYKSACENSSYTLGVFKHSIESWSISTIIMNHNKKMVRRVDCFCAYNFRTFSLLAPTTIVVKLL